MLTATDLRKSFSGVEVLHGVDLRLEAGDVLALLGENGAGKSTLVKMIAGDYQPDAGVLDIAGEVHHTLDPGTARRLGIRMIFQELTDAPALTVAENIGLGSWPLRQRFLGPLARVDWPELRRRAREILAELDVDVDPDTQVQSLRVGERQLVEIARALSEQARILVLDEPTAALSADESERLFGFVRRLRDRGVAMVYITHRLDEVRAIADRVQVLRDGTTVLEGPVSSFDRADLVSAMIGRTAKAVERPGPSTHNRSAPPVLQLASASSTGGFTDVTLAVGQGEVVALYGKVGSGIAEVAEAIYGLRQLSAGRLTVANTPRSFRGPAAAIRAGVGLLPADRQREGVFPTRSVAENLAAPSWPRMASAGLITRGPERRAYDRWQRTLGIRAQGGPTQRITTLSGGNQQKVLLGRWLEREVGLLVLVEPTRGVDVGARQDIYAALRGLAKGGVGVLVATSDYEEVVQLADRALVMARGQVVAELDGPAVTTEALTDAAGG